MNTEDDELYSIEGRQLKQLFNCLLCETKLKKGCTLLCQENVRLLDSDATQHGLVKKLCIECVKNPKTHAVEGISTSTRTSVQGFRWSQYKINVRFMLASLLLGLRFTGVKMFAAFMFNTEFLRAIYTKTKTRIHIVARQLAAESLARARDSLPDRDITASIDGTWMKRYGFSSLFGAVTCLSPLTGKIIGLSVLSRYCKICKPHRNNGIPVQNETHECEVNHFKCDSHNGTANSMEKAGTVNIARELFSHVRQMRYVHEIHNAYYVHT